MSEPQPPRQLSADGKYEWDGQEWVPVRIAAEGRIAWRMFTLPPRKGRSLIQWRKDIESPPDRKWWPGKGSTPLAASPPSTEEVAARSIKLRREATVSALREKLRALDGRYSDVRLQVLRPTSRWHRLTSRKDVVRLPTEVSGRVIEFFVPAEVLKGYLLRGDARLSAAVVSAGGRVWTLEATEVSPRPPIAVILPLELSLDLLSQEMLERFVVRLGAIRSD